MQTQFFHNLELARRSFFRHRVLTALMVVAIALGIGTSMTTLTVLHVLSADPLPGKSSRIYAVQLDASMPRGGNEPDPQLTWYDAEALLAARRARHQALMAGGMAVLEPDRTDLRPFNADVRYTSADFFPLFDVPFARGGPWSAAEDASRARVVVISKELEEKLFGAGHGMGQSVRLEQREFVVVGVLARWRPAPRFYDLSQGAYSQSEQIYLPFSTFRELGLGVTGNLRCWGDPGPDVMALGASCSWVQFWVQLDDAQQAAAYRDFLGSYSEEQLRAGHLTRRPDVRLRSVMEWLDFQRAVPSDVRLQAWLAFAFLAVCLLDAVGLLLAKFLRRSAEIGVRRALGASRRAIFTQFLIEAASVGLVGGGLGLALAWLGLWAVRQQPVDYAALAELDPAMLATSFALALVSSLLAGVLPAWRAGQVAPALQVKAQ
jgi:putative ABC transport system permease protein